MTHPSSAQPSIEHVTAALAAGDVEGAACALERLLIEAPSAEGYRNLALLRLKLGMLEVAFAAGTKALELNPNDAPAAGLCADILARMGRQSESVRYYERALSVDSTFLQAWINLAIVRTQLAEHAEALKAWQNAYRLGGTGPSVALPLAAALLHASRPQDSREILNRLILTHGTSGEAQNLLGVASHKLGDDLAALRHLEVAAQMSGNNPEIEHNKGIVLTALGEFDSACLAYQRAIELDQRNVESRWNAALLLLRVGRWQEGWPLFEARLERATHKDPGPTIAIIPRWQGQEAKGCQKLLIIAEQGLGDTLMFCRYAHAAAQRGFLVSVLAPKALGTLLGRVPGVAEVVFDEDASSDYDFRIELLSLPGIFNTQPHRIPWADRAYLTAARDRVNRWRHKKQTARRPAIGLMWRGQPNPWLAERSLQLSLLAKYLPSGPRYFSLQKTLRPDEQAAAQQLGLDDHEGDVVDFEDAAALIHDSDLVITIDTSIAHLAAGLGAATWVLLPTQAEWRWEGAKGHSLWYPNVRLFRATDDGWQSAVAQVASEITGAP